MLALIIAFAAATVTSGAATPGASGAATGEKKICKSEEVTGSLARRSRICHTATEWRAMQEQSQRNAADLQDQGLISPSKGG